MKKVQQPTKSSCYTKRREGECDVLMCMEQRMMVQINYMRLCYIYKKIHVIMLDTFIVTQPSIPKTCSSLDGIKVD